MPTADDHLETTDAQPGRGFWAEVWRRFRGRRLGMIALGYVVGLILIAACAPAIVGTKPIVCRYKGEIYFPCLGYFRSSWENPVFRKDKFRRNAYPWHLRDKDSESWAVWPLIYQDPYRRVTQRDWGLRDRKTREWRFVPGWEERQPNPSGVDGVPSRRNVFGTTQRGVDVFAQMVHGTQVALSVGFISMGIAATIGITIGALAGFLGGWVDILLSRIIELQMCIPVLVLILALVAVLDEVTNFHLMAIVGLTGWTGIARLTRAEFLRLGKMDFVTAAYALGASPWRIMFRHMLRNALAPVLVPITFGIASAILIESGLSYLGFGASPPNPSWGTLLQSGRSTIQDTWWLIVFPGAAIFLTVLAYNLIGEGIQEATDPRLQQDSH